MDWRQIDPWIIGHSTPTAKSTIVKETSKGNVITPFRTEYLPKEGSNRNIRKADLTLKYTDVMNGGWKTVKTVADGTCLIHALLISTSNAYRKLSKINQEKAGQLFRTSVIANFFDGNDDYGNPVDNSNVRSLSYIRNPLKYLEDVHIRRISEELKINFYVIVSSANNVDGIRNEFSPGNPWVFLFCNLPNHYSAIHLGRENVFMLSNKDFIELYPGLNYDKIQGIIKRPVINAIEDIFVSFGTEEALKNRIRTDILETSYEDLRLKIYQYATDLMPANSNEDHKLANNLIVEYNKGDVLAKRFQATADTMKGLIASEKSKRNAPNSGGPQRQMNAVSTRVRMFCEDTIADIMTELYEPSMRMDTLRDIPNRLPVFKDPEIFVKEWNKRGDDNTKITKIMGMLHTACPVILKDMKPVHLMTEAERSAFLTGYSEKYKIPGLQKIYNATGGKTRRHKKTRNLTFIRKIRIHTKGKAYP